MARKKRKPKKVKVPKVVVEGVANEAVAPDALQRFFRFSQLATGEAGEGRKIEDIWATFLQELEDLGIPAEARARLKELGPSSVFRSGPRLKQTVVDLAGGKANVDKIKETVVLAKAATKGLSERQIKTGVKSFIDELAKHPSMDTDAGRAIITELRSASPQAIARAGATQTVSALVERADEPFVQQVYRSVIKKQAPKGVPSGIVESIEKAIGKSIPKVTGEARAALGAEVAGTSAAAAGVRKGLGIFGKSALGAAGIGIGLAFDASRGLDILNRPKRAQEQALAGFQQLGPSSSVDFLRNHIREQESIGRRKATMQQFEPDLFQQVVKVLSDSGRGPSSLTGTERRIGANARTGANQRGRDPQDVEFLLDQFFSQLGQARDPRTPGQ